jgi:hypothetical protein
MPKQTHAGEAGPITPEPPPLDPFGRFKRDDLRLRAIESRHQTQREIARTNAQASVRRAAIAAAMVAAVLIGAMALGKPVPWEVALSLFLGKSPPP